MSKKCLIIITAISVIIALSLLTATPILLFQKGKRIKMLKEQLIQATLTIEEAQNYQANVDALERQIEAQKQTIASLETQLKEKNAETDPFNLAVDNLDPLYFVTDPENYAPAVDAINISEKQAAEIAQKGFDESKSRIAGEGADDIDSQTITLVDHVANNYFTRKGGESNKNYKTPRLCYEVTRTNSMRCGITIYVDASTGLIIGGDAFGD